MRIRRYEMDVENYDDWVKFDGDFVKYEDYIHALEQVRNESHAWESQANHLYETNKRMKRQIDDMADAIYQIMNLNAIGDNDPAIRLVAEDILRGMTNEG